MISRNFLPVPGNCSVAGWGKVHDSQIELHRNILQSVQVPMRDLQECKSVIEKSQDPRDPNFMHVTDKMICAGTYGKDNCRVSLFFEKTHESYNLIIFFSKREILEDLWFVKLVLKNI